jgi:hypothetical protein
LSVEGLGRPSVGIVDLDGLDVRFEEAQSVRWTDPAVVVWGRYADETFGVQSRR